MTLVEQLTALELIARLPDDTPLTVEEAAIFCRCSVSKMNKMRMRGYHTKGPDYIQGGSEGTRGTNQTVLYLKRDLVAWLEGNRVSDTLEAAVRKGQMFATLISLVTEERAFWRAPSGGIGGLVEGTDVEVFYERLFKWQIVWLTLLEALEEDWESASIREMKALSEGMQDALGDARSKARSLAERAELRSI